MQQHLEQSLAGIRAKRKRDGKKESGKEGGVGRREGGRERGGLSPLSPTLERGRRKPARAPFLTAVLSLEDYSSTSRGVLLSLQHQLGPENVRSTGSPP